MVDSIPVLENPYAIVSYGQRLEAARSCYGFQSQIDWLILSRQHLVPHPFAAIMSLPESGRYILRFCVLDLEVEMVRSPRWCPAFVLIGFTWFGGVISAEDPTPGTQVEQSIVSPALPGEKFGYLLFLPKDYGKDERKWPVMLFLHGAGERGDDLKLVQVHGPPKLVEQRPDFPFIVVSPQCAKDHWWPGDVQQHLLAELLDNVLSGFHADPQRVVVTGLSMGGFGSWTLTARHPNRFAAAVPICGGGDPDSAEKLKSVPFWVFHGAKDFGVPLKLSEDMVAAVQKVGGSAKLTVYPEAEHDSWTETYKNEAIYDWLLAQRRTSPAPLPTANPCVAFARLGKIDLKLGNPDDKNTFAATIFLSTSVGCGPCLRQLIEPCRDKLLTDITAWVNSQSPEQLAGNAGRQRARLAMQQMCDKTLLQGQPAFATEVVFDQYFVRHKGVLKLEAKTN